MPILPWYRISTPSTSGMFNPHLIPAAMPVSTLPFTTLPTAVAAASAKPAFLQKTVAASASPKLNAWLNLPELVAIPMGNSVSLNPKRFDRGSLPAARATSMGLSETAEISPPSSTTATLQPAFCMSATAKSAMTPATAAIGPTFAFCAAIAINLATIGSLGMEMGSNV